MEKLLGFLVVSAAVAQLIVGTIVAVLIRLIPYLVVAAVIALVVNAMSRRKAAPPRGQARPSPAPSRYHGYAPGTRPVVDADVIDDHRDG
jgi:hypothetical protein